MTRDEIIALIVAKANEHGLVSWEFLGGAIAESNLNPSAWRQGAWPDWSAGLFQQTVRWADEGDHTASDANVALIQRLYFDPAYACGVAAVKFKSWRYNPEVSALQAWCAYNLPASYKQWPNVSNVAQRENYRAGLAEAQRILGAVPVPTYFPDEPTVLQPDDWSCAPSALTWALRALGRHPAQSWIASTMVAQGYESQALGLLDASGAGLAQFVNAEYGDGSGSPTIHARNNGSVSYDDVRSVAGSTAVLLGGRNWGGPGLGHWVGVRAYDPNQGLLLANPGGTGPLYGQQVLDRQGFEARGPFSMVVLTADGAVQPAPSPQPADPKDAIIADLRRQLADKDARLQDAVSKLGYAAGDVASAAEAIANTLRTLAPPPA